ncbi:ABC transporter ATPase [Chlamydia pneumoniae TW-183]|uniref:Probable metal transport system ATP-binding protein CPn_0542/CP_0210/CPj0542/CpB0563 n=2 Tax=Chlamydia pneumoniae TaxID=83558 RepID=Y542_CHLPN|nr:metal ABC transporter ATP-binding protein [Chlamydia pneumoniae]Q9Z810.1 RecName: Full=Probable metal transport system ATP-binding protein CPn_0542/CP_0210/CPj0542/CpB0563 [Chlamydia pneumoniae]AAD18682.1 ABC Transporter ATPase [Chlamydia pneumoniae CWL029]AAF73641.1 ABC transporter, ATP-binding protein [Chlamydia pneumoniae AR39]AAP98492.1 ABC transporter ATPase [Chlamydia pneumoniae TW-183]CRI33053.1 Probable metal transport system ATP-binding protein CPn_0542/CP_0210/CPj0542/CpB0563 [Chl
MTIRILAEGLAFRYGSKGPNIIHDVSFSVYDGDFIGIIGPNGGGKSTLTMLILGLLTPTFGSLKTFPSHSAGKQTHSMIGWVPQHFSYDPCFPISVKDVVLSGRLSQLSWHGKYKKKDFEAVDHALDLVGLSDHHHHCFAHLSGGQIQRVLLARALASYPEILILDEPTTNIDPDNQQRILSILKKLNRTCTILMVTHDLHHTTNYFNKVFYMNKTLTSLADTSTLTDQFCCHPYKNQEFSCSPH